MWKIQGLTCKPTAFSAEQKTSPNWSRFIGVNKAELLEPLTWNCCNGWRIELRFVCTDQWNRIGAGCESTSHKILTFSSRSAP